MHGGICWVFLVQHFFRPLSRPTCLSDTSRSKFVGFFCFSLSFFLLFVASLLLFFLCSKYLANVLSSPWLSIALSTQRRRIFFSPFLTQMRESSLFSSSSLPGGWYNGGSFESERLLTPPPSPVERKVGCVQRGVFKNHPVYQVRGKIQMKTMGDIKAEKGGRKKV